MLHYRFPYPTREPGKYVRTYGNAWGIMGISKSAKELSKSDIRKRLAKQKGTLIFFGFFGEKYGEQVKIPSDEKSFEYFQHDVSGKGDYVVMGFFECACNDEAIMERSVGEICPLQMFPDMARAEVSAKIWSKAPPFTRVAYGDNNMAVVTWKKIVPVKLWPLT